MTNKITNYTCIKKCAEHVKITKKMETYAKINNLAVAKRGEFGVNMYLQVTSVSPEE